MSPRQRDILTFHVTWQDIAITVTCEAKLARPGRISRRNVLPPDHCDRPEHCLPFTKTGYRSHFADPAHIEAAGGAAAYVIAWLNHAAESTEGQARNGAARQLALF